MSLSVIFFFSSFPLPYLYELIFNHTSASIFYLISFVPSTSIILIILFLFLLIDLFSSYYIFRTYFYLSLPMHHFFFVHFIIKHFFFHSFLQYLFIYILRHHYFLFLLTTSYFFFIYANFVQTFSVSLQKFIYIIFKPNSIYYLFPLTPYPYHYILSFSTYPQFISASNSNTFPDSCNLLTPFPYNINSSTCFEQRKKRKETVNLHSIRDLLPH